MASLQMFTPHTLEEVVACLQTATAKSLVLAGGTDLVIQLRKGLKAPDQIIDLSGVEELNFVVKDRETIRIGAMTTFDTLARNTIIKENALCLAQAAAQVGSQQIRNAGTIGGNIGTSSPAGDSLPPLLALEAEVKIIDSNGNSECKRLENVLVGVEENSLHHNQVITEIIIPAHKNCCSTFAKLGARSAVTIARMSLAIVLEFDSTFNIVSKAGVALGAIGRTAFRSPMLEEFLLGKKLEESLYQPLAELLSQLVDESIPGRYSQPYKREAVKSLADQILKTLCGVESNPLKNLHSC